MFWALPPVFVQDTSGRLGVMEPDSDCELDWLLYSGQSRVESRQGKSTEYFWALPPQFVLYRTSKCSFMNSRHIFERFLAKMSSYHILALNSKMWFLTENLKKTECGSFSSLFKRSVSVSPCLQSLYVCNAHQKIVLKMTLSSRKLPLYIQLRSPYLKAVQGVVQYKVVQRGINIEWLCKSVTILPSKNNIIGCKIINNTT